MLHYSNSYDFATRKEDVWCHYKQVAGYKLVFVYKNRQCGCIAAFTQVNGNKE